MEAFFFLRVLLSKAFNTLLKPVTELITYLNSSSSKGFDYLSDEIIRILYSHTVVSSV